MVRLTRFICERFNPHPLKTKMSRFLLTLVAGLICCSGQTERVLETHDSPSKEYSLIVEVGNGDNENDRYILMFKLKDKSGSELDYLRTGASDVQKWAVTWYNEKVIILNSSDIGTYAWTVGRDGVMINVWPVTKDMVAEGDEAYTKKYGRPRSSTGHTDSTPKGESLSRISEMLPRKRALEYSRQHQSFIILGIGAGSE